MAECQHSSDYHPAQVSSKEALGLYSAEEIMDWLNDTLETELNCLQDLATGAAFCQIIHKLYPEAMPLRRVIFDAHLQQHYVANLNLLAETLHKLGLKKSVCIEKLAKGRLADILEFSQWLRKFYEINNDPFLFGYDPVRQRAGAEIVGIDANLDEPAEGKKRHTKENKSAATKVKRVPVTPATVAEARRAATEFMRYGRTRHAHENADAAEAVAVGTSTLNAGRKLQGMLSSGTCKSLEADVVFNGSHDAARRHQAGRASLKNQHELSQQRAALMKSSARRSTEADDTAASSKRWQVGRLDARSRHRGNSPWPPSMSDELNRPLGSAAAVIGKLNSIKTTTGTVSKPSLCTKALYEATNSENAKANANSAQTPRKPPAGPDFWNRLAYGKPKPASEDDAPDEMPAHARPMRANMRDGLQDTYVELRVNTPTQMSSDSNEAAQDEHQHKALPEPTLPIAHNNKFTDEHEYEESSCDNAERERFEYY